MESATRPTKVLVAISLVAMVAVGVGIGYVISNADGPVWPLRAHMGSSWDMGGDIPAHMGQMPAGMSDHMRGDMPAHMGQMPAGMWDHMKDVAKDRGNWGGVMPPMHGHG